LSTKIFEAAQLVPEHVMIGGNEVRTLLSRALTIKKLGKIHPTEKSSVGAPFCHQHSSGSTTNTMGKKRKASEAQLNASSKDSKRPVPEPKKKGTRHVFDSDGKAVKAEPKSTLVGFGQTEIRDLV